MVDLEGLLQAEAASEAGKGVETARMRPFFLSSCCCAPIASLLSFPAFFVTSSSLTFFSLSSPPTPTTTNWAPKSRRPRASSPRCSTPSSRNSSGPRGLSGCFCCSGRAAPLSRPTEAPLPLILSRSCRSLVGPHRQMRAVLTALCRCSTTRTRTRTPPLLPISRNRSPKHTKL